MKTIIESINDRVDEARMVEYTADFVGLQGCAVKIQVPTNCHQEFEKLAGEGGPAQDEVFAHITGGNIDEY